MKTFMKQSKKGFTLIEMIVVIVIVAILAAIAVPAVLKYIDEARNTKIIAETQPLYLETQVLTTEIYGKYGNKGSNGIKTEVLIEKEMKKKFESQAISGKYKLSIICVYYDYMEHPGNFDEKKASHFITKLAVALKTENDVIYVVFLPNDSVRVFSSNEEKTELFSNKESPWYINPAQ